MNERIEENNKNNYEEILERSKAIIKAIEARGYKAYIVSETVRKIILKEDISLALLASNAPFELIKAIFVNFETFVIDNYNIALHFEGVPFIIKKFYKENLNGEMEASDSLDDFINEADFTINSLAMDSKTDIIDNYSGYKDLNKGILSFVQFKKKKLLLHPYRAIELLNLLGEKNYKVSSLSINLIKRTRPLKGISFSEIVKRMNISNIINSNNFKYILKIIEKTNLYKDIPVFGYEFYEQIKKNEHLDCDDFIVKAVIRAKFRNVISDEDVIKALDLSNDFENIKKLYEFCISIDKGHYSKLGLFNSGIDLALKGNKINRSLKISKIKDRKIIKQYNALEIKSVEEIKYFREEILHDFRNMRLDDIDDVVEVIKDRILDKKLLNDYYEIKEFVSNYLVKKEEPINEVNIYEDKLNNNLEEDYQKSRYENDDIKQKRVESVNRNYYNLEREENNLRDREITNLHNELEKETNDIVNILVRGLDIYEDEKEKVARELKEAYKNILIRNTSKYERLK